MSTLDAVVKYKNKKDEERVQILTNPVAYKQLLELLKVSENVINTKPELKALYEQLVKKEKAA